MGSFGGYYKGERKKAKKGKESKQGFGMTGATFQLPEIIRKSRKAGK